MWGQVAAENGLHVMANGVPSAMPWDQGTNAFFVSVRCDSADEITATWSKPAVGASVIVDLAPAGWSPLYGVLADPFGVAWVLDVAPAA